MPLEKGFIGARDPHGELFAVPVFYIDGFWRNANGLVDKSELIYPTEFEAINAAHKKYKRRKGK